MKECPRIITDELKVEQIISNESYKSMDKGLVNTLRKNGVPERFVTSTFDNTESKMNEILKEFSLTGKFQNKNIIILAGNNGTGKSRLAACCMSYRVDNGLNSGYYASCSYEICPLIRSSRSFKAETNEIDTLSFFYKNPFLVLDETGKGDDNIIAKSFINNVLSARYDNDLPTLLTTNLTKDELIDFVGKDVESRFKETAKFYILDGEDKRGL